MAIEGAQLVFAHYLRRSSAVCPPLEHKDRILPSGLYAINDYTSWASRGWCRAEAMARLLSRRSGPLIMIDSLERPPVMISKYSAFALPPGVGEFTCCERNHQIVGKDGAIRTIECDKFRVADICSSMVDHKLEAYLRLLEMDDEVGIDYSV